MANKVKFGLKNVHYALLNIGEDGEITFGVPKSLPGAVSLTMDPEGDEVEFEADDGIYYASYTNSGYKGTLEIANITDEFRTDVLQDVKDKNGVFVENSTAEAKPFALLYEINGDQKATRRVLYNNTVARPGENASTTGKTKTPQTDSMSLTAVPLPDGVIRARTGDDTSQAVFDGWYKTVYLPQLDENEV